MNFITAHDGFTLRDLVSYNDKHNEANGEDNRDGTDDNRSWNCGVEGETDDPSVNALRARQQRNFLATLLLSQGVPMVLGGDEIGRTQRGNNNAWCQDNEISWIDWGVRDEELLDFTRRLIELRRAHPVFRRTKFFDGTGEQLPDVWWMRPDGRRMTRRDWDNTESRAIGIFLNGDELGAETPHGEEVRDDSFLVLFNAFFEEITFRLPARRFGTHWELVLSTGNCAVRATRPGGRRRGRVALARALPPRVRATYRLQLTPEFGFAEARELVPYLRELGVSHLYLSPVAPGAGGLATRIRRRRPAARLRGARRRAAAAGARRRRSRRDPRHRPEPHGGRRREPVLARPRAARRCSSTSTSRTGFHRRFFDVAELGGVKQEEWEVFWATHAKVIELVRDGVVDGVRVDHPDGLANPAEYLARLRDAGVEHVWVEKILEPGEELRAWPVEGTTGYEFLNDVLALCVNAEAEEAFTTLYEEFTGDTRRFEDIAALAKLEVAVNIFEPELRRLHEEVTLENLPLALASFHVYRTYIEPHAGRGRRRSTASRSGAANVSEELRRILFLQEPGNEEFVVRFQQTTGPVTAKGDRGHRVLPLLPARGAQRGGRRPGAFRPEHRRVSTRRTRRAQRGFPLQLLTTYTHDTKRSPDVRSRIAALSWFPERVGRRACAPGTTSSAASTIRARSCSSTRRSSVRCRSSGIGSTRTSRRHCAKAR